MWAGVDGPWGLLRKVILELRGLMLKKILVYLVNPPVDAFWVG